jgi:hypothetical protein
MRARRLLMAGMSGVVLCIVGVVAMWNSIKTSTWEQSQATVTSVSLIERHSKKSSYTVPDISYQYEKSSHQYQGHGIAYGSTTPFAVGAPLSIYVNPADPSQSSISKGLQLADFTEPTAFPLIMGLVLISAAFMACIINPRKRA